MIADMKSKLLSSLTLSFYIWFLTPLLTFFVFLGVASLNNEIFSPLLLLLTPAIGCISFAVWLSRTQHFSNGLFLIGAEGCRGLYIFVIGYLSLLLKPDIFGLGVIEPTHRQENALAGVTIFLFTSLLFYLAPDTVIGLVNLGLRKKLPKTSWSIVAIITTLIGFVAYYMATQGLISGVSPI